MDEKTLVKLFYAGCGTIIACFALYLGYDGKLALLAVGGLFGGEKLIEKLMSLKIKSE